jgi:hypothetical protein
MFIRVGCMIKTVACHVSDNQANRFGFSFLVELEIVKVGQCEKAKYHGS